VTQRYVFDQHRVVRNLYGMGAAKKAPEGMLEGMLSLVLLDFIGFAKQCGWSRHGTVHVSAIWLLRDR